MCRRLVTGFKTFVSERPPWQQHGVNGDVRLPNRYTYARFEKVQPITSKDINHFQNIINCYSYSGCQKYESS